MTKLNRISLKFATAAITHGTILVLLTVMTFGNSLAFAQAGTLDPALEVFRIPIKLNQMLIL